MNTSKNIKLAIIFLVGTLIGLVGYSRFFSVATPPDGIVEDDGLEIATTTEDANVGDVIDAPKETGKKSDTEKGKEPVVGTPKVKTSPAPVSLPLPNLDKIIINANIPDDKKQEYTGRMKDIVHAIRKGESLYEQLIELASYRKLVEDYAGAEEIWLDMTKRYPTSRQAYDNLGNLYHFYVKDYPKAEVMMKKSIEIENVYAPSYVNLFELYTLSYTEKKQLAEQVLLDGLKNTDNHITLEVALAQFYAEQGRTEDARIYFEKVLAFGKRMKDVRLEEIANEGLTKLSATTTGI